MTQLLRGREKSTEADIAYEVLKAQAGPLHYLQLIEEVLRRLEIAQDAARIAAVLTQINMDTRFSFLGNGEWGLKTWETAQPAKRTTVVSPVSKAVADEEEDLELEPLEEEPLEEEVPESENVVYDETDENQRSEKW